MLTNPTIETLKSLKLHGMIEALEEQQQTPTVQALSFEERIALIVDRERLYRDNQRRTRLLRGAHLKVAEACVEDINYKAARGLDKRQIAQLATGEWIRRTQNVLITGATGSGKT
jgi:DNA replication protein DnaC